MEIVIHHAQEGIPRALARKQVAKGHGVYYVHMLSREGMLMNEGKLYIENLSGVSRMPPAHLKNVQLRCKCANRLSGNGAGNEMGFSMSQGQPPAKPLASCSVFLS